jgi:hypothetical protein
MKSTLVFLFLSLALISQAQQPENNLRIAGVVKVHRNSGTFPSESGTRITIPGMGDATTDSQGTFTILLNNCDDCTPGKSLKVYVNSKYGYAEDDYVIPEDAVKRPMEITIYENNKILISGTVKDKDSGRFIKGISVRINIPNYEVEIPDVVTDEFGQFKIVVNKQGIGDAQAITLLFMDKISNNYKDKETITYINQYVSLNVDLEKCETCGEHHTFNIGGFVETKISLQPGDILKIQASGLIRVGPFVGTSGPKGIDGDKGFAGGSLAAYNITTSCNHGCLLYRTSSGGQWQCYSEGTSVSIQDGGTLQFQVNDNDQGNNSGSYKVEITVKR